MKSCNLWWPLTTPGKCKQGNIQPREHKSQKQRTNATWKAECKWSIGLQQHSQKKSFLTSENRGISSQMFSVEKLPLLIKVNLIQLMGAGGMHWFPSLLSSLLYLATCKLTNNMTNHLDTFVPFSAMGNL